jgi:hypothetical protein
MQLLRCAHMPTTEPLLVALHDGNVCIAFILETSNLLAPGSLSSSPVRLLTNSQRNPSFHFSPKVVREALTRGAAPPNRRWGILLHRIEELFFTWLQITISFWERQLRLQLRFPKKRPSLLIVDIAQVQVRISTKRRKVLWQRQH